MQKKKNTDKAVFNAASLFFLIIAVTLIAIGVYLNLNNRFAVDISQPGRYGQGGGTLEKIPGLYVIGLGILFACFPIIDLIRYLRARL